MVRLSGLAVIRAGVFVRELLPRIAEVAASPVRDHLVAAIAVDVVDDLEKTVQRPARHGTATAGALGPSDLGLSRAAVVVVRDGPIERRTGPRRRRRVRDRREQE